MSELPAPLVAADVDLCGFSGFMLNVDRLMASELVALGTPEECWAAMMLWCRAWKQTPPGSLPDDERVLRAFSGAGPRWGKVKSMALRGFVKCSDGRLYHRVLCEEANEAWERRKKFKERSAKANERRWAASHNGNEPGTGKGGSEGGRGAASGSPSSIQQGVQQGLQHGVQQAERKDSLGSPVEETGQDKTGQDLKLQNQKQRAIAPTLVSPTRAGAIAARARAAGVQVTGQHPVVQQWAEAGITDAQLDDAVERARLQKPAPALIPAKYLDAIVQDILHPPAPPERKAPTDAWWTSPQSIDRKARELGIHALQSDTYDSLKTKIFDKLRGSKACATS